MQYTYFFNLTSPFSNFHPSIFKYKEHTFISNEQFMMYGKAMTFKDFETAQEILEFNSLSLPQKFISGEISREDIIHNPEYIKSWNSLMMGIKNKGKKVKNFSDETWEKQRHKIVFVGAKNKFIQNSDLYNILKSTNNNFMVEASGYDKIWGCGLWENQAKTTPQENWPGLNLLGRVLNTLKEQLFPEFYIQKINLIEQQNVNVASKSIDDKSMKETNIDIDFWDYIRVVNVRGDPEYMATRDEKVVIAHRGNPTLGNKHPMNNKSMMERDRVIAEHKKDLEEDLSKKGPIYNELKLIAKDIVEKEQKIALSCFCAPCNCHAHSYLPVIVKLAEDLLLEKRRVKKLKN